MLFALIASVSPTQATEYEPLPDSGSGITRDVGSIAIIEHDGSNYDKTEPSDGTPNFEARAAVARRFYQSHGDFYDFLLVFTNFEFETGEATAFYSGIRNSVDGIGKPQFDNGPLVGSPNRLSGFVDMAAIDRYRVLPYSAELGLPGFRAALNVVSHEMGHQWLAAAEYLDSGGLASQDLLGKDGSHWSFLLDSDASVMYGSDWTPDGDGTYTATRVRDGYSDLDLYLMGFLDPAGVDPFTLLRNPAIDPLQIPQEGARIPATPETITVAQVVAAEGTRSPDHLVSPKIFRVGFIFLTAPGVEPAPADLAAVERFRRAFPAHFFALTRGVAIADTSLAETPSGPPAPAPDLDLAVAWLLAQQSSDGSWQDSPRTTLRDTGASLEALLASGARSDLPYQTGLLWLLGAQPANVDFIARQALALGEASSPQVNPASLTAALLSLQALDGGFGVARGFQSDSLDTALALRALEALGYVGPEPANAVAALADLALPNGLWPLIPNGEASTIATAQALLALLDWSELPGAQALLPQAVTGLLSRQNPDGGFGESPSTPYATALALRALIRANAAPEWIEGAVAWLESAQLLNGSWRESRFETALVVSALEAGVAANLIVPSDSVVLTPNIADEGDVVHVTARVRNAGRTLAAVSVVRLYDGDPAAGVVIGEQNVPALAPEEEHEVEFDYDTLNRPGTRTLYLLADAEQTVRESREDDNGTARNIKVKGSLPDLVAPVEEIVVTPHPPEDGEVAEISVTVRNLGERQAASSVLRLVDGEPRFGGQLIGEAVVPALAIGEAFSVALPWDTTGQSGSHELYAVADADFDVDEGDAELNNQGSIAIEVVGAEAQGADLAFGPMIVDPARLETLPQTVTVRVRVLSLGSDAVSSSVALYDGDPATGVLLAQLPVDLGSRASILLSFDVTIGSPGTRTLVAVADPDAALTEIDETNNQAFALLSDPQDSLDLELRSEDIALSSTDLIVGEVLEVTAMVHNRGTAPVTGIPVILYRNDGAELIELSRTLISVAPAESATAALDWTTSLTGDPVALIVSVDPFDLLQELSETNNDVELGIRVQPSSLPNFSIDSAGVSFDPDPPLEGSAAQVSLLVSNTGVVASEPSSARFFVGDPADGGRWIGEAVVPSIAGGTSESVSIVWAPVDVRGAQGIFVVADPDELVAEFDETDNQAFRPFAATGLPDLVLAAADVSLEPAFPRAGEPVVVRATVRNLGGQAAPESALRAVEAEDLGAAPIAEITIPILSPGESVALELTWIPSAPPGERPLGLFADVADAVSEQDEGNNSVRNIVLVQDADLFLTHPYFSPDGDGVRDETRLGYRAVGAETVVVSDSRGRAIRTLEAPSGEGLVTWDGRDDGGALLWDGAYTLSVLGAGDVSLGRLTAVLDTNRSPLHDAAASGLFAVRNMTCSLPLNAIRGPAWMPAADEVLFVVSSAVEEFAPGLLRMPLGGEFDYIAEDPWYEAARPLTVSPDGQELLLSRSGEIHAVGLADGARRLVAASDYAAWSPDGRFIVTSDQIVGRDGSAVVSLPEGEWIWSPDSAHVAAFHEDPDLGPELEVVDRAGSSDHFPLPHEEEVGCASVVWRGDGQIVVNLGVAWPDAGFRPPGEVCLYQEGLVLDPESRATTALPWDLQTLGWSPDGSKVMLMRALIDGITEVALADGRLRLPFFEKPLALSPDARAAYYLGRGCPDDPSAPTLDAVTTLENLSVDLRAFRLPANNGILLEGTVADRHLERWQVEFATESEPDVWRPVGAASSRPVIDDTLAVFVPADPGNYSLRLSAEDLAGNRRSRVRVVSWDQRPALANLTQSEALISPNGDGVKDAVQFDYFVQEPTLVVATVKGPATTDPGGNTLPGGVVRTFELAYSETGPSGFVWDGRDSQGSVVPDGDYQISVNGLPLAVEVDTTPPGIGYSYGPLRLDSLDDKNVFVTADRSWHVVDTNLRTWAVPGGSTGTTPVFVPETDANGNPVLENGRPQVAMVGGRPVDEVLLELPERLEWMTLADPAIFEFAAEDHAGNRAIISVAPLPEELFVAKAGRHPAPEGGENFLRLQRQTLFILFETVRETVAPGQQIRFEYRDLTSGTAWIASPPFWTVSASNWLAIWRADFEALGLPLAGRFLGRFVTNSSSGFEVLSGEFKFRFCEASLDLELPTWVADANGYSVQAQGVVPEELTSAKLVVTGQGELGGFSATVPLQVRATDAPGGVILSGFVSAPETSCDYPNKRLVFDVQATDVNGTVYRYDFPCLLLTTDLPRCRSELALKQLPQQCEAASPDLVLLSVEARTRASLGLVVVNRASQSDPIPIASFEVQGGIEYREVLADVTDVPEGMLGIAGRLEVLGETRATASRDAVVDRTPPLVDVLSPLEGGELCVEGLPGSEEVLLSLDLWDLSPYIELESADLQYPSGDWESVSVNKFDCVSGGCTPPPLLPSDFREFSGFPLFKLGASEVALRVTDFESGTYGVRFRFCDWAGHHTTVERHFEIINDAPWLSEIAVSPPIFSPNQDAVLDLTILDAEWSQTLSIEASLHEWDGVNPGLLARQLLSGQTLGPGTHALLWDGRDDAGEFAPDRQYVFLVTGTNGCGATATLRSTPVTVDTLAPDVVITSPTPGELVGAAVNIRGTVSDLHLAARELSWGEGEDPVEWFPVEPGGAPIGDSLGQWAIPSGLQGLLTLRVFADDRAGNSAEARVTVDVSERPLLDSFAVTPSVFSPNGDEQTDQASFEYTLSGGSGAAVTLRVLDASAQVVRTLLEADLEEPGVYTVVWDGLTQDGLVAPDAIYEVRIRVEDPAGGATFQEESAQLALDTTTPVLTITQPSADACVIREDLVLGAITDAHLTSFSLFVTPNSGAPVEIATGTQSQAGPELAALASFGDGEHVLSAVAQDAGFNQGEAVIPFVIDTTDPRVRIATPAPGAVLLRGEEPIPILGSVQDDNLVEAVLSFGPGPVPSYFVEIARTTSTGTELPLGDWSVSSLPDGVYTLKLEATDCSGHVAQARTTVTLDGEAPVAVLSAPEEGGVFGSEQPVVGTASDLQLEAWELESAPGPADTAFQWSPVASGETALIDAVIVAAIPFLPDGIHTLRLTVRDQVGLEAVALRSVVVDNVPPAAPTGLAAEVIVTAGNLGDVKLTWAAGPEPDLAGYRMQIDGEPVGPTLIEQPTLTDVGRVEGVYDYALVAVDEAGNVSDPATIQVRVDVTPPLVAILSPDSGAVLSGSVDIRGTAFAANDFDSYRLQVGVSADPTSFTLLRESTLSVSAGVLGTWLAIGDGPHVLLLEAKDTSGNSAQVSVAVLVDNVAPDAPALSSVIAAPDPDTLTVTWQESAAPDVAGYLVYRNGSIANAPGILIGDPDIYAVPGPDYVDATLPDGTHCYTVQAMDEAGNLSPHSNELCETLDNRAPQAFLVAPPDGLRFDLPILLVAQSLDQDLAFVEFQISPSGAATWIALGASDTTAPFEMLLDPDTLTLGPYDLRAVATDLGGQTDPAPAAIGVVYGDATPPLVPLDLVATVDGENAQLTWTASSAPDLAGYHVSRDAVRLTTEPIAIPSFDDPGLALGSYEYAVIAVDEDGNESPAALADALVYTLALDYPFPITEMTPITAAGSGAVPGTTIEVAALGVVVAQAPATDSQFVVAGVPLAAGFNTLEVRGVDALGNRSVPATLVFVLNAPPGAVTGLTGLVDQMQVDLAWEPVTDPDLHGYLVRRDDEPLFATSPQTQASSVTASSTWRGAPGLAFDGNPATFWSAGAGQANWTATFPQPVLVERVRLSFVTEWGVPTAVASYRIEARLAGAFVPLAVVEGNQQAITEHIWPAPLTTDALRVVAPFDYAGLSEVTVLGLAVVPADTTGFTDTASDGIFDYAVSAIDRYGAEGPSATFEASVGDVTPPAAPTGLVATLVLSDVLLTWDAGLEPDLDHYVVIRDGERVGTSPVPQYTDLGPAVGTHIYTVLAVDTVDNESDESAPATVDIVPPAPSAPPAPEILQPTDAATPVDTSELQVDVSGLALAGTTVTLDINGRFASSTLATQGEVFTESSSVLIPEDASVAAIARDGRSVAYRTDSEFFLTDVETGTLQELTPAGFDYIDYAAFSFDGRALAYVAVAPGEEESTLFLLDLETGQAAPVDSGPGLFLAEPALSPSGDTLAYVAYTDAAVELRLRDLSSGATTVPATAAEAIEWLRWSPDSSTLAFFPYETQEEPGALQLLDVASGSVATLDIGCIDDSVSWSADGRYFACPVPDEIAFSRLQVHDLLTGESVLVSDPNLEALLPQFSATGVRLTFVEVIDDSFLSYLVRDFAPGGGAAITIASGEVDPADPHTFLADGRIALPLEGRVGFFEEASGVFEFTDVVLDPGTNTLIAQALDTETGLSSPDSAPVTVNVIDPLAPDLELTSANLFSHPALPLVGQPATISARVHNIGTAAADDVDVGLTLVGPGPEVISMVARVTRIEPGANAIVSAPWTPTTAGTRLLTAEATLTGGDPELRYDNNVARAGIFVSDLADLNVEVVSDRSEYPVQTPAAVTVALFNPGPDFQGIVETRVEDLAGQLVALVDTRSVTLAYAQSLSFGVPWNSGVTFAGDYVFKVRALEAGLLQAEAAAAFRILPDTSAVAELAAQRTSVTVGEAIQFDARADNLGLNAPLLGYVARLQITPSSGGGAAFETAQLLPTLLPGGVWEALLEWSQPGPAGDYQAALFIQKGTEPAIATATAAFEVTAETSNVSGTLSIVPSGILSGETFETQWQVTNGVSAPLTAYPILVEVLDGAAGTLLVSESTTIDAAAGETVSDVFTLSSAALPPGLYPVRLRGGMPAVTFDLRIVTVHGPIAAPSLDSPADGERVSTSHPELCVNNATSPEDAALTYTFELFDNPALTQALPGAQAVPEGEGRTCWRVELRLGEDRSFYWRARATDGFSSSAWTDVASFFVDEEDLPPQAPLPDAPAPGARVAVLQPDLVVSNALDPERQPLTYEFRVATDAAMTQIITSATGVAEGDGLTSWTVPVALDENATYYWSARASDGTNLSPWSLPISFIVDTTDESPTSPGLLRPVDGGEVATLTPELAVSNATDPDGALHGTVLVYFFEIDDTPSFDSPALQVSPPITEGVSETAWIPTSLQDDTLQHWRGAASDGNTQGPWVSGSFFVNLSNDAPQAPALLAPADGQVLATAQPALRVRNAVDVDLDALAYEFEVTDASGSVVATTSGVLETPTETEWTLDVPLAENEIHTWRARAADSDIAGPWSATWSFRVNAVDDPPSSPTLDAPTEGSVLELPELTLSVFNATSPDLLLLSYEFELHRVEADGTLTLVDSVTGVPEAEVTTAWAPTFSVVDGDYSWRARAADANQPGAWMPSAHFTVALDAPPAAVLGLAAVPGNESVALTWTASPEPDVTSYRVYRSLASGGPYALAGSSTQPLFEDVGLTNGVTVFYVVTALDANFESLQSAEAAATPFDPTPQFAGTLLVAPTDVLAGDPYALDFGVSNAGMVDLVALPVSLDVSGVVVGSFSFDLAVGESLQTLLPLSSLGLGFGVHTVTLYGGDPAEILAVGSLSVHAPLTPASIDSPADGARVPTAQPMLRVNNASSPEAAVLTYEFQLFADAPLTQLVDEASGISEASARTSWAVSLVLDENETYFWRARATDGFSLSEWTDVASFMVDELDEPPTAPVPDSPADGAVSGTSQPTLVVINAADPEGALLTYEFQVGTDAGLSSIVTSTAGLAAGMGLTSWVVGAPLDEDVTYYWRARADDGANASAWSTLRSFSVDTYDGAPSAPSPISPVGDVEVVELSPALTAENAVDPEGAALSYRFEIDTAASFDSADLQVSPDVPESASETQWTPALPLLDNTHHYWRVAAFDGNSQGPWASASFFVNLGNDLPSSPVPLSPAEAAVVASTTPTLRVTNAQDLDNDALSYEFEVMDAVGAVVASATGVIEGPSETAWTVTAVLSENGEFTWHARAYDDEGAGAWSVQRSFRVNALDEPPSAPELVSPLEGTILDVRQVPLVVSNASSPEGRVLSYRFELYSVDDLGQQSLVAEVSGLPEGAGATQWSTGIDLGDGEYSWRARAEDGVLVGPWMASAHFAVAVDVAPSAPLNLEAVPGDTSVTLSWDASVEPDVFAYRVYRSLVSGAGYALVDEVAAAAYTDLGLTNGTTYFYVVTALDTQFESASSAEVAATPNAGPTSVPVDVRFDPWSIAGECLVVPGGNHDQHHHHRGRHSRHQCGFAHGRPHGRGADSHTGGGSGCPSWVFAKIVVPEGTNPYSVDVASIRLEGSVAPDPDYKVVHWHWRSVRVRFALWKLLPLLDLGANPLELTGRAGETDISGTGVLHVRPLRVALQIHPSVLESALVGTRHGDDDTVTAKLRFTGGVKAHDVDLDSLRLNGQVSVEELLSANGSRLRVTFDRDEVLATLPEGHWVEVTVSGEVGGIPFAAMDHVQVVH